MKRFMILATFLQKAFWKLYHEGVPLFPLIYGASTIYLMFAHAPFATRVPGWIMIAVSAGLHLLIQLVAKRGKQWIAEDRWNASRTATLVLSLLFVLWCVSLIVLFVWLGTFFDVLPGSWFPYLGTPARSMAV